MTYESPVSRGDIELMKKRHIASRLQKTVMTCSNINKLGDIHYETIMNELSPELKDVIN